MKVAIIGSKGYDTLEYHLADSFRFLNHQVTIFDISDVMPIEYTKNLYAIRFFKKYDEYIFKTLARKIIENKPDLIIATYRFINPLCIKIIKKSLPHTPIIHV